MSPVESWALMLGLGSLAVAAAIALSGRLARGRADERELDWKLHYLESPAHAVWSCLASCGFESYAPHRTTREATEKAWAHWSATGHEVSIVVTWEILVGPRPEVSA